MYNVIENMDYYQFGPGKCNDYSDFKIKSSSQRPLKHYDVLIFTDSKGSVDTFVDDSKGYSKDLINEDFWTDKICEQLETQGLSFLFISRPKILTIFFTLINFLMNNNISYNYLITNLGFVDFTPKKEENMQDILLQSPYTKSELSYKKLSPYKLRSGIVDYLYTFNYGKIANNLAKDISKHFTYSLLIGCMEFSQSICIPRERPIDFFNQLKKTNEFLFEISNLSSRIHYFQPIKYPYDYLVKLSEDAVHFTQDGHNYLFKLLKPYVKFYLK